MADKNPFFAAFSERLRAAMVECEIKNAARLAELLGVQESRARNWANGTAVPGIQEAIRLRQATGTTLDWLYDGKTEGLSNEKRIRLMAVMDGLVPPAHYSAVGPEDQRAPYVRAALPHSKRGDHRHETPQANETDA